MPSRGSTSSYENGNRSQYSDNIHILHLDKVKYTHGHSNATFT